MSVRQSKVSPSPSCPFETRHDIGYRGKGATAPKEIEKTSRRIGRGWRWSGDGVRETRIGRSEDEGNVWEKKATLPTTWQYPPSWWNHPAKCVCERMSYC